ncbi:MAG: cshA 1 [Planctomycetaceae bacterium]|nr:cshA 1 [Planctomycetaceae bacterium]
MVHTQTTDTPSFESPLADAVIVADVASELETTSSVTAETSPPEQVVSEKVATDKLPSVKSAADKALIEKIRSAKPKADKPAAEKSAAKASAKPEKAAHSEKPADPVSVSEPETTGDGFTGLGLDERLLKALIELGYEEPTPIQREAIPPLLEGRDVIGQAATGTGKTAAFALPLIQRLVGLDKKHAQPAALILVPTRELASQVAEAVHRYGKSLGISVLPIYGGQSFSQQFRALQRGVDIIVATPGRALDHIRRETLQLGGLLTVILDEADEMFDMGFAEDIEAILAETPEVLQTVLFSATLPPRIAAVAKRHQTNPVHIQVAREASEKGTIPKVRQTVYMVQRAYKLSALGRVLDLENPSSAIVFCRTRTEVDQLTETLVARGYRAESLHGGMSQEQRERVMKRLRGGSADLVIATDVAARGLDIEQLSHVVNYDVPTDPDAYVHRIGRVGRAGREGVAITLVEPREHRMLRQFEHATKQKIEIAQVPTVADLRTRRLDLTRAAIQETLLEGDMEHFRVVVESLSGEFDLMNIALAAVKLAHQATVGDTEEPEEIPPPRQSRERPGRGDSRESYEGGGRSSGGGKFGRDISRGRPAGGSGGMARLFIGIGRNAGIRPQDLVGAIAGEAGISGSDVGAIEINDRFSLVDVTEASASEVIDALRATKLRGQKFVIRRDNRE